MSDKIINDTNVSSSIDAQPTTVKSLYRSLIETSNASGIPKSVLIRARKAGSPGFLAKNRFDISLIQPFVDEHRKDLEGPIGEGKFSTDTLQHYRKEIAKRDVVLKDLAIAQKKEELIDPAEIKLFLNRLGVIVSSAIKKQRQELMSKCIGYEKIVDESTQDIFRIIQGEMDKWK